MRGKWVLFAGIVILAAIAAGALSVLYKPSQTHAKKEPVAAAPPAEDEIALNGKLQAAHIVPVPAPIDGVLEAWDVEVGQDVLEGQQLGHVRNSGLESAQELAQTEVDRAQARMTGIEGSILSSRLEAARADADATRARIEAERLEKIYTRNQMLLREGAIPRIAFEKSEREYESVKLEATTAANVAAQSADRVAKLEKDLELARKALDDRRNALEDAKGRMDATNIVAPGDGTVIALKVEAGAEVERGMQDLVQLAVDPAILEFAAEPEPRLLERIKPGQHALVMVPEITDEGLAGQVREIKDTQVIVEFTSPNPAIKHGLNAGARIRLTELPPPSR